MPGGVPFLRAAALSFDFPERTIPGTRVLPSKQLIESLALGDPLGGRPSLSPPSTRLTVPVAFFSMRS